MPYSDIPLGFNLVNAEYIDKRMVITDLLNLSDDLPLATRVEGYPCWVKSEKKYYHFKNSTADIDFVEVIESKNIQTLELNVNCVPDVSDEFTASHNLGDITLLNCRVFDNSDNDEILVKYYLGGNDISDDPLVHISIKIAVTVSDMKIVMYYFTNG